MEAKSPMQEQRDLELKINEFTAKAESLARSWYNENLNIQF